ncbi:hypothetical protein OSTOST_01617 [Ostertagia ostertagi]
MGLISVGCPASTSIPIGSYTMTEFTHLLNSLKYPNGKPEMFAAFNLARDLIYAERSKWQTIMVFSNARYSTQICLNSKLREDEFTIADELRRKV